MSTRREFLRDTLLAFAATTALARTTLEEPRENLIRDYHIKNLIASRNFYVDARVGDDSWDGLAPEHILDSNIGPWKTFRRIQHFGPAEGGVSLWIAPGNYESKPWTA